MKKPRVMQKPGSYKAPMLKLPGSMNSPRRGRVGKVVPPMKRLNGAQRRGR